MKIYTGTGDDGTTGLFAGGRVYKTHPRVEAFGTVDELNSFIGAARAAQASTDDWLRTVQNHLFHLGADLATPLDAQAEWVVRTPDDSITWLEGRIDEMTEQLPPLKHFILPGGCPTAAHLHIARSVCRRAERLVVQLAQQEPVTENAVVYLNRLSDFLFTLARYENLQQGVPEEEWHVAR
ncbi:MAG: cob(I)yrinic acid a,c-diamide adenosyltransferase [Chloroflexota bacterium]